MNGGRLEVGRIAKPHGLRGAVIVSLSTNRLERIEPGTTLFAGERGLVIVASQPQGHRWLVSFEGVESREAADALHGAVLFAEPLEDADELWVHELIGSEVVEVDGTVRGHVTAVEANPASDLLVLDSGALVPLVFATEVETGRVVIDPPEGLFEAQ